MKPNYLKFLLYLAIAFVVAGCGGGSSSNKTLTVTITNPIGTIAAGSAAVTVSATVANDGSTPGVAWTLVTTGTTTSCQPACGALSGATATSVVYTPPATVPSPATATLIATSNSDSTKTATDNITISTTVAGTCTTPGTLGNEAALTAPFAFILKGQDSSDEPVDYIGSFTPNGSGGITHADLDINGFDTTSITTTVDLDNSSYSYGSDGRGCLFIAFNENTATVRPVKASTFHVHAQHSRKLTAQHKPRRAAATTEEAVIFAFALLNSGGSGRIQEFDNTNGSGFFAAGQMHAQTASGFSTTLSPNFAFGIDGWVPDEVNGIDRSAIAGSFANSSGTLSDLTADENFAGIVSGEQSGGSGTLNTPSSTTGRGTGTLTINSDEGTLQFDFVYYVVNSSDVFIMSSDDPNTGDGVLFGGRALSTGTSGSSPSGNFIYAMTGLDCATCATTEGNNVAQLATLGITGPGAATAKVYLNDGGTFTTNSFTGTFTLELATQRGQVTGVTETPPVAYFTNTASEDDIVAFMVGTDAFGSGGFVLTQTQSTPNFGASSIGGNYAEGTAEDISGLNGSETGVWDFSSSASTYSNILDQVQPGGTTTTPLLLNGTYTVNTDGSGTYSGPSGTTVAFVTSGAAILSTEESSTQPQLHVFIQQPE